VEARAIAKYIDVSPRKARLVVDVVRGQPVAKALAMLQFMPQRAARHVRKVIQSAAANAENNYALDPDTLIVSRIYVDEGPSQKRFRPRAHGRVSPLIKRTSHVTAIVAEKEGI
jgi:large subunit ribosomal protein L22